MGLTIPVPGGEVWAEDAGGDGAPVVLVHADWTDSRVEDPDPPVFGRLAEVRVPAAALAGERLAQVIAETVPGY
jgi:hypothetical protein